jgi:hypothetical protein
MVCEVRRVGPGSCGRSIAKTQGGTKLGALWASEGTVVVTASLSGSGSYRRDGDSPSVLVITDWGVFRILCN